MIEVLLNSWEHVCQKLFDYSWQSDIMRHRSPFVFRGLSDKEYDLKTSLVRLGGNYKQMEYHLLRNFRKYGQLDGIDSNFSDWKWMTIAQHHGLPTRLLDWTFSPFVALHFLTYDLNKYDKDGAIWCVDFVKTHDYLPSSLKDEIRNVNSNVFTIGMIESKLNSLSDLENLSNEEFVIFFEPPSMDSRIVNQYALFSIMNNSNFQIDKFLEKKNDLVFKYIIPKELKWEIRNKLDQANISERMLFPGLDGLAQWLKRHYGPTPY